MWPCAAENTSEGFSLSDDASQEGKSSHHQHDKSSLALLWGSSDPLMSWLSSLTWQGVTPLLFVSLDILLHLFPRTRRRKTVGVHVCGWNSSAFSAAKFLGQPVKSYPAFQRYCRSWLTKEKKILQGFIKEKKWWKCCCLTSLLWWRNQLWEMSFLSCPSPHPPVFQCYQHPDCFNTIFHRAALQTRSLKLSAVNIILKTTLQPDPLIAMVHRMAFQPAITAKQAVNISIVTWRGKFFYF